MLRESGVPLWVVGSNMVLSEKPHKSERTLKSTAWASLEWAMDLSGRPALE